MGELVNSTGYSIFTSKLKGVFETLLKDEKATVRLG